MRELLSITPHEAFNRDNHISDQQPTKEMYGGERLAQRQHGAPGPSTDIGSLPTISAPSGFSTFTGPVIATSSASALTTIESTTTFATFTSNNKVFYSEISSAITVTNTAEYAALTSAATSVQTDGSSSSTSSSTVNAAGAASGTSTSHKTSKLGTLIPEIVVPVVVVLLLASFGAFWFIMRRRHRRAIEQEMKFENPKPKPSTVTPLADNSSSAHLVGAGAAGVRNKSLDPEKDNRPKVEVMSLPSSQASSTPRHQRQNDDNIPASAIGIARSTSSASPAPSNDGFMPPRSAHSMRDQPSHLRPGNSGPRSPALSSSDIIDAYGGASPEPRSPVTSMRPNTAPNGRAQGLPAHPLMRHPSNSNRDAGPRHRNGPPPPYAATVSPTSRFSPRFQQQQFQSQSPRTASPALKSAPTQSQSQQLRNQPSSNSITLRALAASPDNDLSSSHGLTEENLRIARLVNGSQSSLGMNRYSPDNASISDIDEHDRARVISPDGDGDTASDVSSLDEEQERMASRGGWNRDRDRDGGNGSGRSTPMVGPGAYPLTPA